MRQIGFGAAWLLTLLAAGLGLATFLGWIEPAAALDFGMGTVALGGLWLIVWLPWDLYFAARALIEEQKDSLARGIEVSDRDRTGARRMSPRLLALCLGLHIGAAGAVTLATWFAGGSLGYWFAGFFLVSMGLRPLGSLYRHVRRRLEAMRGRTMYPREDVVSLLHRVQLAEDQLESLNVSRDELTLTVERVDQDARTQTLDLERQLAELVVELERSMAKLTRDRELLQGVKALVRVIKDV